MNDKISIIVPVYNVEKYIKRCLESIINQTYKNIEIICVNDGSTDNSGKICEEYADKDSRIKVIHKKNGGLSDARNVGISLAKGKYISFIDSDDFINYKMIESLYRDLRKNNVRISVVGFKEVFDDYVEDEEELNINVKLINNVEAIKSLLYNGNVRDYAWGKLYDATLFNEIKFPLNRKMEDLGTMYLLFEQCEYISYNETKLYYYYQRYDSILHNFNKTLCIDKLYLALERYEYINKKFSLIENDIFLINAILETYPYIYDIEKYLCKQSENIIKKIKFNVIKKLTLKQQIKLIIFKINKTVYSRLIKNMRKV